MNKSTYTLLIAFISLLNYGPCFGSNPNNTANSDETTSSIKRVRLDFVTPLGYTRHLLLGFTPNDEASDGVDYGYDALNIENLPDDMNWMINNDRYIIQGVGTFDISKSYPLGLFMSNSGTFEIALNALENFETNIDVFIYDSHLNSFASITNNNYTNSLETGTYANRFFVTFTNDINHINFPSNAVLSITDTNFADTTFSYVSATNELNIKTNATHQIKTIDIYGIDGKAVLNQSYINNSAVKINLLEFNSAPIILKLTNTHGSVFYKQLLLH